MGASTSSFAKKYVSVLYIPLKCSLQITYFYFVLYNAFNNDKLPEENWNFWAEGVTDGEDTWKAGISDNDKENSKNVLDPILIHLLTPVDGAQD